MTGENIRMRRLRLLSVTAMVGVVVSLGTALPVAADSPSRERDRGYRSRDYREIDKEREKRRDELERERDKRAAELARERDKREAELARERDKREFERAKRWDELEREREKREFERKKDRDRNYRYHSRRDERPRVRIRTLPPRNQDWDRDGVPNHRDRYPRNPDRR